MVAELPKITKEDVAILDELQFKSEKKALDEWAQEGGNWDMNYEPEPENTAQYPATIALEYFKEYEKFKGNKSQGEYDALCQFEVSVRAGAGLVDDDKDLQAKLIGLANQTQTIREVHPKHFNKVKPNPEEVKRFGAMVGEVAGKTVSTAIGCGAGLMEASLIFSVVALASNVVFGPAIGAAVTLGLGGYLSYKATQKTIGAIDNIITPVTTKIGDNLHKAVNYGVGKTTGAAKSAFDKIKGKSDNFVEKVTNSVAKALKGRS